MLVEGQGRERWLFEVRDSGPGIPRAMQEKIFEPFTQGAEGKPKGGTGLGLAIARRQIELMGGGLKVESEVGKGARFFFSLPLPPAKELLLAQRCVPQKKIRRLKPGFEVKALVVDDIAENRDVLRRFLQELGVEFEYETEAQDAEDQEAAAKAAELPIPLDLLGRLQRAAEMYSVTEFENFLPEVEALGPTGRELADRLRDHSRNVRMDEILRILENLHANREP